MVSPCSGQSMPAARTPQLLAAQLAGGHRAVLATADGDRRRAGQVAEAELEQLEVGAAQRLRFGPRPRGAHRADLGAARELRSGPTDPARSSPRDDIHQRDASRSTRAAGGDRGAGCREDVPDSRPPRRHAQGACAAPVRAARRTASCARCAASPSTSTRGEFFGIVGRNGSGKSTLLKIMSSIYRADRGRIRMAGRLAPFIELGVGFNPELTSRENVVLNGVMMGLARREAQRRLDAVLDFAELRDFSDLKLKNYSSGMMVRLAFAVMVEADADIMLVDEVLAVGDASFAQKCMDVFREKRARGPHARARHARHGDRPGALRPGDAAPRRRAALPRRPRGGRAALLPRSTSAAPADPRPRRRAACRTSTSTSSTPGSRTPQGERVRERRAGRADRPRSRARGAPRRSTRRCSASTSSTRTAATVFGFNRTLTLGPGEERPRARASASGSRGTIENPLVPGPLLRPAATISRNRHAGRPRAPRAPAARLRRLRHRHGPGRASGRRRRAGRARVRRPGRHGTRRERAGSSSCATSAARRRWAAAGGARSTCCYLIAVTDFKRSYLGTALGYLWSLARPLLLFGVLLVVFTRGVRPRRPRASHYPVLLLFNIVLFTLLPGVDERRR